MKDDGFKKKQVSVKLLDTNKRKVTNQEKDFIRNNLKWPFSWTDFFGRYFIIMGPISISFIAVSMFFGGFKFGHIYENSFINSFFFTALTMFLLGLFLTYYIIKRIESEKRFVLLTLPINVLFDEIPDKLKSLKWSLITKKNDEIEIATNISFFSWGESVTILKVESNKIVVNTRPNGCQPFTFNRDRVNFKKLKTILH